MWTQEDSRIHSARTKAGILYARQSTKLAKGKKASIRNQISILKSHEKNMNAKKK